MRPGEDIEGRVRALWKEAFNGRELDALDAVTAPEFVNHNALPGTPPGPEGHRQVVERLWTAFPDAHFEIDHLGSDGDTVICVGTMSGTHEGTLLGVPGTGRKVAWRQCHLYRFDDSGRAVEHDAIRDDVGLLRQFGTGITHLFAGVPVSDLEASIEWYTRFFGRAPDNRAGSEILWEVAGQATLFIEPDAEQAGTGRITFAVEGLEGLLEHLAAERIEHAPIEIYSNGVRHVKIPDPDGNAIAFAEPLDGSGERQGPR